MPVISRQGLIVATLLAPAAAADPPPVPAVSVSAADLQARLQARPHPRLILTPQRLDEVRRKVDTAEWAKTLDADLRDFADELMDPDRGERNPPDWKVHNATMREVSTFALLYRLHGDRRYLDAAERRMLLLARNDAFRARDGRRQSLPVSNGILGLAVGYDWLYHDLSQETRAEVEGAILHGGFDRLFEGGVSGAGEPYEFPDNNWRQVILGAHAVAALAIGERHPEASARVLNRAVPRVAAVAVQYRPDGVCPEGTHYWDFGMQYHAAMLDALHTGLGEDFDLSEWPVLADTARWRVAARGPQGDFPFGDGARHNGSALALSWWAMKTGEDWLVRSQDLRALVRDPDHRSENRKAWMALPLIWLPGDAVDGTPPRELLTFVGQGDGDSLSRTEFARPPSPRRDAAAGVVNALCRSAWDDPEALWLAAVAGRADVSHGHMHAGSFVLDWGGVRWIDEPATHHYDRLSEAKIVLWTWGEMLDDPSQRGRERVYAWGNRGHNTLMIDGRFHRFAAAGTLTGDASELSSQPPDDFAVGLDLAAVLGEPVTAATRRFHVDGEVVTVTDRWTGGGEALVMIGRLHTSADVRLNGRTLTLRQDGRELRIGIDAPDDAAVLVRPADELLADWDRRLPGVTVIDVRTPTAAGQQRTVRLTIEKAE